MFKNIVIIFLTLLLVFAGIHIYSEDFGTPSKDIDKDLKISYLNTELDIQGETVKNYQNIIEIQRQKLENLEKGNHLDIIKGPESSSSWDQILYRKIEKIK